MVKDKYVVISDRFVEHLVEKLNSEEFSRYEIQAYFQEMGVTKILLKETNV